MKFLASNENALWTRVTKDKMKINATVLSNREKGRNSFNKQNCMGYLSRPRKHNGKEVKLDQTIDRSISLLSHRRYTLLSHVFSLSNKASNQLNRFRYAKPRQFFYGYCFCRSLFTSSLHQISSPWASLHNQRKVTNTIIMTMKDATQKLRDVLPPSPGVHSPDDTTIRVLNIRSDPIRPDIS
jgi:hypothetical protein